MSDRKRASCTLLLGTLAVLIFGASPVFSQQPSKPIRVGILASGFEPFYAAQNRGLVAALRDHGYVEGKNLIIERRYGHLDGNRFSVLAQELAGMNLDAIVTVCTGTTRAAKGATNSTPIVMLSVPDPVGQGLAASLAHPGANVTGRSSQHFELVPKILQVFHEAMPNADRIAVLVNAPNPIHEEAWTEALAAAQSLNVDLIRIEMQGPKAWMRHWKAWRSRMRPRFLSSRTILQPITCDRASSHLRASAPCLCSLPTARWSRMEHS